MNKKEICNHCFCSGNTFVLYPLNNELLCLTCLEDMIEEHDFIYDLKNKVIVTK